MAKNLRISNAAANAGAAAITELLNHGYLRLYDGTQPNSPDVAVNLQNLLAELRFSPTAFGDPVGGIANANELAADPSAPRSGTATWFRAFQSDGVTPVLDGSIAVTGGAEANINLVSVNIQAGLSVAVTAFSYTQKKAQG